MRRQQGDKSGARDFHNGFTEEACNSGLVHVHPCCRLQPGRLSPDPPIQGQTVCPPPKQQGNPAGLWSRWRSGTGARGTIRQEPTSGTATVAQQARDRTGAARHHRCCVRHRQTWCHHSRQTWRAEESLDSKSRAASSVWCHRTRRRCFSRQRRLASAAPEASL